MQTEIETENKEGLGMNFQIISMWVTELVIIYENLEIEGAIFWPLKLVIRFILKSNNVVRKPSHAVVKKNNVSKPNGIFEASKRKRCENADRRNQGV